MNFKFEDLQFIITELEYRNSAYCVGYNLTKLNDDSIAEISNDVDFLKLLYKVLSKGCLSMSDKERYVKIMLKAGILRPGETLNKRIDLTTSDGVINYLEFLEFYDDFIVKQVKSRKQPRRRILD